MRRRAYLLPKDSMVHKIPVAKSGEHQFAAYNEEDNGQKVIFYDEDQRKISNFWAIPSFKEIFEIEIQQNIFATSNLANLYKFDLGDPSIKNEYGEPKLSEFAENNQRNLLKARLPTMTPVDFGQAEIQMPLYNRIVDF